MKKLLLIVSLVATSALSLAASSSGATQSVVIAGKTLAAAPLGDLSKFRAIAVDTLALVKSGKLSAATARVKALETLWDTSAAKLQVKNAAAWGKLDGLLDSVLGELRIDKPQASACTKALVTFIQTVDSLK